MPGIELKGASRKIDWKNVGLATGEIVAQAFLLNINGFSNALSALFRGVQGVHDSDPVDVRARALVASSFAYVWGMSSALLSYERQPTPAQFQDLLSFMATHFDETLDTCNPKFERTHLTDPESFALIDPLSKMFIARLRELACTSDDAAIYSSIDKHFIEGLRRMFIGKYDYYSPVEDFLHSDTETRNIKEHIWKTYYQRLKQGFEGTVLIGEDQKDGVTLAQVYQPLRSIWEEWEDYLDLKDNSSQQRLIRKHVNMLDDEIEFWLSKYNPNDAIRLISGGPGSGKSTFAKRLASIYADREDWRTLLIPLQRISAGSTLSSRINDYFGRQIDEPFGVEYSPLSELGQNKNDWLIIFDGLDELAGDGKGSDNASQEFASSLNEFRAQIGQTEKVRFVVLGRAPSMQDALRRLGLLGKGTLFVQDMLAIQVTSPVALVDPRALATVDQREDYWKRIAIAKSWSPALPEAMVAEELNDLTKEPLLAYLLIWSGFVMEGWERAAENRNRIYSAIFDKIWDRERTKPTRQFLQDLGKDTFASLMQALGLAAWQGAGRTGDEKVFAAVKQAFLRPNVLRKSESSSLSNLENTAVLFYTRRDESGNAGFEFLHKSFGEYLTGVALTTAFLRWARALESDDNEISPRQLLQHWMSIARKTMIDPVVLDFILNEVKLQCSADGEATRALVAAAVKPFDLAVREGFPVDISSLDNGFTTMELQQKTARVNLLAMLSALGRCAYTENSFESKEERSWSCGPVEIPAFKKKGGLINFFNSHSDYIDNEATYFVQGRRARAFYSSGILHRLFSRLDLREVDLSGVSLATPDFSYVNFEGAYMNSMEVRNANFSNASLSRVRILSSHISAIFKESSLQQLVMSGVTLEYCYFIKCNLSEVELGKCKFRQVVMDKASLQTAHLSTRQKYSLRAGQIMKDRVRWARHRITVGMLK